MATYEINKLKYDGNTYNWLLATHDKRGVVLPWQYHSAAATGPSAATNNTAVAVNTVSTTAGKYYAVEADVNGRLFVNVPWSDNNTDTKVNMVARGTTKAYLLGTTTAPTSSNQGVTSVAETGVYFDTTTATLVATTFKGALTGTASGNLTSSSTLNAAKLSGAIPSAVTATTQTAGDNSTKIATTAYVDSAITGLPTPMQFIGSVGTGGTITWANLATASESNSGYTYKVITDHTAETGKPAAKTGDTIVSNGSEWVVIPSGDEPSGTVTSVRVQATSPVQSSVSTAQSTSLNTTISLADGYGDTKNPYGAKTANYVLAGPSSGSAAAPTFRALVAADIPTITKSKISDFPTSMTPTSHTHGNIQNDGTLQTNDITIASGDKLVVTDSSDSNKIARTSIEFDGSTTTQALSKAGTWVTVNNYSLPIAKYNTLGGVKPAYSSTGAATLTDAAATNTATPTIASKSTTAGRYYAIEADKNGILFVNVPWTDHTYTIPTGAASAKTGITIADHATASIGSASGWSAGSGSASLAFDMDSTDTNQLNITFSHTHTAPSLTITSTTVVTGKTHSITDPGHTHTLS